MRIVDNTTTLLGDDLKQELAGASKLRVAAACFSIYAFDALKNELGKLKAFEFIFTSPSFMPDGAIDKIKKERREFFIPREAGTGALSGSPFEIQLRNKMTQRAVAREVLQFRSALVVCEKAHTGQFAIEVRTLSDHATSVGSLRRMVPTSSVASASVFEIVPYFRRLRCSRSIR